MHVEKAYLHEFDSWIWKISWSLPGGLNLVLVGLGCMGQHVTATESTGSNLEHK